MIIRPLALLSLLAALRFGSASGDTGPSLEPTGGSAAASAAVKGYGVHPNG